MVIIDIGNSTSRSQAGAESLGYHRFTSDLLGKFIILYLLRYDIELKIFYTLLCLVDWNKELNNTQSN